MTPQFLEDYADWTVDAWSSTDPLDGRDFAIMGLGLSGEVSEVAEVLECAMEFGASVDMSNLRKELGDALYYWARICRAYEVPLNVVWPRAAVGLEDAVSTELMMLRLVRPAGRVSEHVKKHVRDGAFNRTTLVLALHETAKAWVALCRAQGLCVQEVLETNRRKVDDRRRRGVMGGSGDNR